ncbi:putative thiamine biosynthesis protein (Thi-4) [Myriangium duriaei CBS 260.36]|uniref:Thiamine biosynthesis protein (Thi-4) n=1 Tax=Myriangium duriaei CBS 260.36 TaxID=1168546 RepID=A0A9P4IX93_9PEZI|nr:putative thiamine biosynthesis protein (Thi-4) [Myriangium duriaei CBS 260.36]
MTIPYNQRRVLVIAGSDSSGGAGLEADQKVIAAHGCYAMTATTALTAQNTQGVKGIHVTPPDFVAKQIGACAADIGVDVVKTGMLACADTVKVVAKALEGHAISLSVIDPVMISTSGSRLLPEDAIRTMIDELLPRTFLLTPNIPEAVLLLSEAGKTPVEAKSLSELKELAQRLAELGPRHVLVKGGHLPLIRSDLSAATPTTPDSEKVVANVLYSAMTSSCHVFISSYQSSPHTHGTGCSLASAIACNLLQYHPIQVGISKALDYVSAGIRLAQPLGHGAGPISHFHSLQILPFAPGTFIQYLLRHPQVRPAWRRFTHHQFVTDLASGTLPAKSYRHYLAQDYLYLIQFARANALAGYKAKTLDSISASAEIVLHIQRETALHVRECEERGLSLEEMQQTEEDAACTAYSRFILDTGMQQDWLALQIAMLPCLLGYGMVAARLVEQYRGRNKGDQSEGARLVASLRSVAEREEGAEEMNIVTLEETEDSGTYRQWIENYVADDYTEAVRKGCELVEGYAAKQSPARIEELMQVFLHATNMETGFWDMGLRAGQAEH